MSKNGKAWLLFDDSNSANRYGELNEYPIIIRMRDGGISVYHENGVRESLVFNLKDGQAGFIKMKITDDKKAYDHFVKRALAVSDGLGTQEDWDKKVKEVDEMMVNMMEFKLEENYKPKELITVENEQEQQTEWQGSTDGDVPF